MIRKCIAAALMCPTIAFAQNAFLSTPREAHNLTEARNFCNMKANLFVQASDDRDRGVPPDIETLRLRAAMQHTRLDPSDIDDLVQMAYSSNRPAGQIQPAILQACMAPFGNGFPSQ